MAVEDTLAQMDNGDAAIEALRVAHRLICVYQNIPIEDDDSRLTNTINRLECEFFKLMKEVDIS